MDAGQMTTAAGFDGFATFAAAPAFVFFLGFCPGFRVLVAQAFFYRLRAIFFQRRQKLVGHGKHITQLLFFILPGHPAGSER